MVFASDKNVTRDVDGFIGVPTPLKSVHPVPLGYLDGKIEGFFGKTQIPEGSDLNTMTTTGQWLVSTTALANTLKNLPVGPFPAVAPNLALNSKQLDTQIGTTTTNNPTYWTVSAVTVGAPSASPKGTTTVSTVASTGSPRGNGMLASVYNMDGLNNTGPARTITVSFTTTTANPCEYRVQSGGPWIAMAVGAGAWNTASWDVGASTHTVLEVRKVGGAAPGTELVWITDVISTPGVGTLRAGQAGLLQVTATETRVMQEYYQIVNLGPVSSYRWALFRRLRASNGTTWGPWFLQDPPIPVNSEAEQDLAAKVLGANENSPVRITRADQRSKQAVYTSYNGDTWYGEAGSYVSAPNWRTPTLQNNFANYPVSFLNGRYRRTTNGIVILRGLLLNTNVATGNPVIFNLPVGYRPAAKLMFIVGAGINGGNANGPARVDVYPNGDVVATGIVPGSYLTHWSLGGIMFPCAEVAPNDAWTPLPMLNSFYSYSDNTPSDRTWPTASYWVDHVGLYWMRGMVGRAGAAPAADTAYGQLPVAAATNKQLHYISMGTGGYCVQHYSGGSGPGTLWWKTGSTGVTWFHVPTFPFVPVAVAPESQWANHTLINGWANYDPNSFPPGSLWEAPDGIVHNRGLVRSGSTGIFASPIPSSYMPTPLSTDLMVGGAGNAFGRIDVNPSSLAMSIGNNAWLSLENLVYLREA